MDNKIGKQVMKSQLKKLYTSSVKPSYFGTMGKQIDEDTFRIIKGFQCPADNFPVYQKQQRFYLQQESFFSCFSARKPYQLTLFNLKLSAKSHNKVTQQFFNFQTQAIFVENHGSYFTLAVLKCDKRFYFEPATQQKQKQKIVSEWVALLNKIAQQSKCREKKYSFLPQRAPQFYKKQHIDYKQFEKKCNSLDIILFRSEHSAARVQQLFTNSQYDHVGIMLRNKKNQLFIFESTSNEGVSLTPWKHLIRFQWYDSTQRIAWKKLNIKLTQSDIAIIQTYISKTLGKQFQISVDKLFTFNSTLQRSNQEQESKTYFCSQLAARLYKQLGLLDKSKASSRYYPVDFSDKGQIKLQRVQVRFEPQCLISFNKN